MAKPPKRDTCLIDTVDRDNLLAERIAEEKTPCLPSPGSCIYRVPTKFLSANNEMYEPIGKLLSDKGIIDCFFIKDDKVSPIVDKLCPEVVVDILSTIRVETGNSKIPSSKIEVHPLANGFAANMDPAETSRLFSAFNADGDRVITSSEFASYLRVLGSDLMKVEGLESFIEKMDLHGNKKMDHNWLWDWIITMKKKMGLGTPAKNAAGNVIKKQKY